MALSGRINVMADMALTADPVGSGASVSQALQFAFASTLTDGTIADKADRIYYKRHTLSVAPTQLDLAGTLKDAYGNTVTFAEVVGIFVKNNSTTAGQSIHIGGDSGTTFAGWISEAGADVIVPPRGCFCIINPNDPAYPVVSGTADVLMLSAAAGTPTADVMILGRSA